ncbi:TfuA-like protein [Amycolatopsis sp. cg5]|uniref:TfuA-like protein n=1 Tax=Amycolatopsis sp. cg5 TaxID=3238802 RepID=UPI003523FED1
MPDTQTLHVFAGPSLSGSSVLELEGVCAHPPIAHGDLYRLNLTEGDSVLIVDGIYQHTAPVRHKEILALHAAGVPIYGTASLGALRATEHQGHGMTGVGTVFGWYRDGRLISDADVALSHGDADVDYRAFTQALVSIISVTDRLVSAGRLDETDATRVVDLARSLHFISRTNGALRAAAAEHDLAEQMGLVLDELRADRLGDIKRIDAEAAVHDLLAGKVEPPADVDVPLTTWRKEWSLQHTPATADPEGPTLRQLIAFAQLFLPDFPQRHTEYVLASLKPEYPEVGESSWLDALSPAEYVRRGILSEDELTSLTADERATRVLVRTFRRRSGRLVYDEFPAELAEFAEQSARLLNLTTQAAELNPNFHPGDIPSAELDKTFGELWGTTELVTHVLDRGFRSPEEFREQARPYFIAARAFLGMRTQAA